MKPVWKKPWVWVLVVFATVAVVVHLMLAIWVRDYVNRKLSENPDYRGHVDAVTLHLWRGAYSMHYVKIEKTSGHVPVPLFFAPLVTLSVEWTAVFHGAFVGD